MLVFTRTKHGANRLTRQLGEDHIAAAAIHGNKSQAARTRALADFKQGSVRVLVATDIAARGIDIDRLPYVVNFELPDTAEHYVHRIGRTGRAGRTGLALSLVCREERRLLADIERLLGHTVPERSLPEHLPRTAAATDRPSAPRNAQPQGAKHRNRRPRSTASARNVTRPGGANKHRAARSRAGSP